MSGQVVARAPGKVFLLGEYAVLDGGRAVVAAVDRYVEVRAIRSSLGARIRIDAPGVQATAEFAAANPPVAEGPLRFALAAFHAAVRRMPAIARLGLRIEIASDLALPAGTKTGLGSSAAVCAAVTAALFAAGGTDPSFPIDREQVFATAFEAHQLAQAGVGSGADVAASCYGGLVCVQPQDDGVPLTRLLTLPSGVTLLVGWTGDAASTTGLVQRYLAAGNGAAARRVAFVRESAGCVEMFISALALRSLSIAAVNANGELLERLGVDLQVPLLTPALRRLVTIARACGAGAKLSGAGGGDCGVALTRDAHVAERIRAAWSDAGIVPLDVALDSQGVTVAQG